VVSYAEPCGTRKILTARLERKSEPPARNHATLFTGAGIAHDDIIIPADAKGPPLSLLAGGDAPRVEGFSVRKAIFWMVAIGAMVLGIAAIMATVRSHFYGHEVTREFVRAIGEAMFIAGFLAVTVDRYVKWYLLREVTQDISKYLIGYNLPTEIQGRIGELMATAIIRREFEQHYILERDESGTMRLTTEFRYTLMNCANSAREFTPRIDFEKHEAPTVMEFRCDSSDKKAVDCKTPGNVELTEKQDGILSIALKRINVQPGVFYHVSGKYFRTVKNDDSDLMAFIIPTIGVTIRAEYPDGISFSAGTATIETKDRWEFQTLFVGGQHIHVRWFVSGDDVTPSTSQK
jgi:hypothetical protein